METKKSFKVDLEKKRGVLTYLGLAISVGVVFSTFSYTVALKEVETLGTLELDEIVETLIPITTPPPELTPPPPPPMAVVDMIVIVEDDSDLDDSFDMMDTDIDDDDIIPIQSITEDAAVGIDADAPVDFPDVKAEFPGGEAALLKFLGNSVRYPSIAAENGISGKVNVRFIINKDGSVEGAVVMRSVDSSLAQEAIRVVNSMPKWKPGMINGMPVRMYYRVPITFQLQN